MSLTIDQIKQIPELMKSKTNKEIGQDLGADVSTITRWVKKLRDAGYQLPERKPGRRKIQL